jgi:hypothetical protein
MCGVCGLDFDRRRVLSSDRLSTGTTEEQRQNACGRVPAEQQVRPAGAAQRRCMMIVHVVRKRYRLQPAARPIHGVRTRPRERITARMLDIGRRIPFCSCSRGTRHLSSQHGGARSAAIRLSARAATGRQGRCSCDAAEPDHRRSAGAGTAWVRAAPDHAVCNHGLLGHCKHFDAAGSGIGSAAARASVTTPRGPALRLPGEGIRDGASRRGCDFRARSSLVTIARKRLLAAVAKRRRRAARCLLAVAQEGASWCSRQRIPWARLAAGIAGNAAERECGKACSGTAGPRTWLRRDTQRVTSRHCTAERSAGATCSSCRVWLIRGICMARAGYQRGPSRPCPGARIRPRPPARRRG